MISILIMFIHGLNMMYTLGVYGMDVGGSHSREIL